MELKLNRYYKDINNNIIYTAYKTEQNDFICLCTYQKCDNFIRVLYYSSDGVCYGLINNNIFTTISIYRNYSLFNKKITKLIRDIMNNITKDELINNKITLTREYLDELIKNNKKVLEKTSM